MPSSIRRTRTGSYIAIEFATMPADRTVWRESDPTAALSAYSAMTLRKMFPVQMKRMLYTGIQSMSRRERDQSTESDFSIQLMAS